ncbi:MAG: hypothetical protein IKU37_00720 [Candidatus Gastranaerophilales bacterium]|nr:hypothetical protein [Candidatus Gastranaerophilales bacterium]
MALVDKEPTILQVSNRAGIDNTININLGFDIGDLNFNISNSSTNFSFFIYSSPSNYKWIDFKVVGNLVTKLKLKS